jgi:hypothetical protein
MKQQRPRKIAGPLLRRSGILQTAADAVITCVSLLAPGRISMISVNSQSASSRPMLMPDACFAR